MSSAWSIIGSVTTATKRSEAHKAADLGSEAWTLLQELVFSQRPRWMAVIREYDLIPPHWIALQTLEEPKPMGELAKQLSCDNSNVTWITDRLEERGLVTRTQAPHDRRVRLLVLTQKGRRLRDEISARLAEPPPAIAELSNDEQRALQEILARVVGRVRAEAD
jgi:MarR family transcriptional regulator, organic hydroperoxide resistance regulator